MDEQEIAFKFWNFWKGFLEFIPKRRLEKILQDKDSFTYSSYVFLYLMEFADNNQWEYYREKRRNDFTIKTKEGQELFHIEHENVYNIDRIRKGLSRLSNSTFPIKVLIAYSKQDELEANYNEITDFILEQIEKKSSVWLTILGYGQGIFFLPKFPRDSINTLWLSREKKFNLT